MKFSESWLKELIDVPVDTETLAEQLTMAGLEVEAVTDWRNKFSMVIVGKLISAEAHPDADKLTICQVDIGVDEIKTVICGADNVHSGECYAYAKLGARLTGDIEIKKRTIKGIHSEGMLCSEKELGLADSASGIYQLGKNAIPGQDLEDYLGLNDNTIELSLTPNRGDCLSLVGIAREVAVLNQLQFSPPEVSELTPDISTSRNINIHAVEACPAYSGRIVKEVNASLPTPTWIVEKLRRCGIRSINVVVDLTNYVMLELGQPMHAFDNDKLEGNVCIRLASMGEKLILLDGSTQTLAENTLVIADDSGAIAMAGIMGGEPTSVSLDSRTVFLESAFFSPQAIMGRARQYGLHTDASHRFERGVDPHMSRPALERLTQLLIDICGGMPGPVVHASELAYLPQPHSLSLRSNRLNRLLGQDIEHTRVTEILTQLGFGIEQEDETHWHVTVPSYRFDIEIEADLVEEVARIYGYARIKERLPQLQMNMGLADTQRLSKQYMAQGLVARGYREVVTYSFVDPKLQSLLLGSDTATVLMNPISAELSVMRQSLWPGLLSALQYNIKRQHDRLRLFESGNIFDGATGTETPCISGLSYGNIYPKQWDIKDKSCDFYDLKSDIEAILSRNLQMDEIDYVEVQHSALHAGQAAEIRRGGQKIGIIGTINPRIQKSLGLASPVGLFELDLTGISREKSVKYVKFSKFPSIKRDISIIIDEKIAAIEVLNHVKSVDTELLTNLELFDVYQGEGIDSGKKSLALGLTFQRSSSTLTDEEADIVVNNIINALQSRYGATLRE